jgi:hypothetical protein
MPHTELRMSFADQAALARELDSNLRHGRAFILGAGGVEALIDCVLVLVHPTSGHEIGLRGQVVMVSDAEPVRGIGIQLRPFDANVLRMVQAFVDGDPAAVGTAEPSQPEPATVEASELEPVDPGTDDDALQLNDDAAPEDDALGDEAEGDFYTEEHDGSAEAEGLDEAGREDEADGQGVLASAAASAEEDDRDVEDLLGGSGAEENGEGKPADLQHGPARHERLRKLSVTQQYKVARFGELNDRVMLERIYSKAVWEPLLQNPKLTLPEVARIARKGSAPRPLIEQIVENNAWIQSPLVRRALLTNPRVSSEGILKLLRITPRPELKVICKTTTYSTQVRDAARKVLDT